MTAAQVSASTGPLTAPVNARSSDNRRPDQGDTSFRDTLASASRSQEQGATDRPARVANKGDKGERDTDDSQDEAPRDDGASQAADQTSAGTDLTLILAALGGGSQGSSEGDAFAVAQQELSATTATEAVEPPDAGPALPGLVSEDGEDLEASKLLALLKSTTAGSDAANEPVRMDIKATVVGQETHLAVDVPAAESVATLPEVQDAPISETPALPTGDGEDALNAALAKANEGTVDAASRAQSGAAPEATKAEISPSPAQRPTPVVPDSGRGAAFAGPGISGRDAGQQDGGGSSSSNSQQQNPGVFASMVNGTDSVRRTEIADAAQSNEPVSDQIAREVRAELRADGLGESSSDGVVKVLKIELKPANLGSVTVRLALKDNAITVHLETQRQDTLAVIERERDALVNALQSQGYSVDGITTAPQSESSRLGTSMGFGDGGSSGAQGGMQGQANQGQGLGNSSGGSGQSGQSQPGNETYRTPSNGKEDSARAIRNGADGLYV